MGSNASGLRIWVEECVQSIGFFIEFFHLSIKDGRLYVWVKKP